MGHYGYLLILLLCLLVTLPLELLLGTRVYLRIRDLFWVCVPIACVYSLVDVAAIARGLWRYNERMTTGVLLPGSLPVEEVLFFLVVPICAILSYEAVGSVLRGRSRA